MPVFYMNDYSKLGLRVALYDEALHVLKLHHYKVIEAPQSTELILAGAGEIPIVVRLLLDNGIACEMTDTADSMYQG